jgi:hypothetical protein
VDGHAVADAQRGENIYLLSAVVFHRRILEVDNERISRIENSDFHSSTGSMEAM